MRAEEQLAALQAQVQAARSAAAQAAAAARAAEARSHPETVLTVGEHQAALRQLDELQARHDALERQHAALQHRVPGTGSSSPTAEAATDGAQLASGAGSPSAGMSRSVSAPPAAGAAVSRPATSARAYCPAAYAGPGGGRAGGGAAPDSVTGLPAQLLERDVALFDAQLHRDQAVADAERQRRRLHSLLDALSPHPHDAGAAAAIAQARQLAGLPAAAASTAGAAPVGGTGAGRPGGKAAGAAAGLRAAGGPGGGAGSAREAELLATVELLKGALERTKKGLESGVPSSKFMAAVVRACLVAGQIPSCLTHRYAAWQEWACS